jgi:predicted RecB family nuclease
MPTRFDVSAVPPQGGYIAKQCPVVIQWDVIRPAEPAPEPPFLRLRMDEGVRFEEDVVAGLERSDEGDMVLIPDTTRDAAVRLTVEAMESSAPAIIGGWLPIDERGRRTGKPDVLVHAGDGYVPIDFKAHLTLEPGDDGVWVSHLEHPAPPGALRPGVRMRSRRDDALQLAHYRRLLEACGHAASSSLGGIYGKEGVIAWRDLHAPMWTTPAKSDGRKQKRRSTMEVYDFEFEFRLDIAAAAADPETENLVVPLRSAECDTCRWRDHCRPIYEAGSGDPSLLPGVRYPLWRRLRDVGITDREGVAALHLETARLMAERLDAERVLAAARGTARKADVASLLPYSKKQQQLLEDTGIRDAGAVIDAIDPVTAGIGGGSLAGVIISARAAVGEHPLYRLPGRSPAVPRFDVEIDLDMENAASQEVYLWGALVTGSNALGGDDGYRAFVGWDPPKPDLEREVFDEMWAWLRRLRGDAAGRGLSCGVFVWTGVEAVNARRIASGRAEVDELLDGDEWVDLYRVYTDGWTNGESGSLKAVGASIGFEWEVDDPGGADSMVKHAEAVRGDEPARQWLLDYNRSDVEATRTIREWMSGPGRDVPEVSLVWPGS